MDNLTYIDTVKQLNLKSYPGNKGTGGSFQNIINEFPPHTNFISGMAGSGAVEKMKLLATGKNIVFELDAKTIAKHWADSKGYTVINSDWLPWIAQQKQLCWEKTLIYFDPPYKLDTRSSGRKIYKYEWTDEMHIDFLKVVKSLKCKVALSHYKCDLYDSYLKGWRCKQWQVMTRTGPVKETLYMNYSKPVELHQYNFLGDNFTERQRHKRRRITLQRQLQSLPIEDRISLIQELNSLMQVTKNYLAP